MNVGSAFLKDPASSFLMEVGSACVEDLESTFSKNIGFLFSKDEGSVFTEDTGSGFPEKVTSGVPEIEAPCAPTVSLVAASWGGMQVREGQAKLPPRPSEQEAPSLAPLGLLCLESMPGLWAGVCLGGAGLAFSWEGQLSLMARLPAPRLPSCGQQWAVGWGPGGLESFQNSWSQLGLQHSPTVLMTVLQPQAAVWF